MKKFLVALFIVGCIVVAFFAWKVLLPNTNVDGQPRFLYIRSAGATEEKVMKTIADSNFLKNPMIFQLIAGRLDVWERLRPGKYELSKNTSILELARKLRNGTQSPVNLVITKIRTKEQLASLVGRRFETDSTDMIRFLNSPDSLSEYQLDSNTVMTAVFPDTYTYLWVSRPSTIFRKLYDQRKKIWTEDRINKAQAKGLNPVTAYTLASIVEEETNIDDEKGEIASVYLNRLKTGMRLGADPTVKFALRDFDLRRIYEKHLQASSPYNTYRNAGLPPGPICTPSLKTLDAVLNAPETNYLYFVAKSDFSQRHVFTSNYADHLKYAKQYQAALTKLQQEKAAANDNLSE